MLVIPPVLVRHFQTWQGQTTAEKPSLGVAPTTLSNVVSPATLNFDL